MNLIVNADDFGKDEKTTNAILDCFADGSVTHTTCMVNMPDIERAMRLAKERGLIDRVGLHLNITEGMPLTDGIMSCHVFCDHQGRFNGGMYRKGVTRFILQKVVKQALSYEIGAQIARFKELGGVLMHADSHHHVHFDWSVLGVALPALQAAGFKSIRIGYNMGNGRCLLVKVYRALYNHRLKRLGMARSDFFGSMQGFKDDEACLRSSDSTVEIMVHPGAERE